MNDEQPPVPLDPELLARLPNFFILGAAKAGTTALFDLLAMHPEVYVPKVKEPHFFSSEPVFDEGIEWYVETHYGDAQSFSARGDATPHYLFYEKAAVRIADLLPVSHHRFIVMLRNPVDRAYSLYWNMIHDGFEEASFEEAIELESRRSFAECERLGRIRLQYLESGLYAKQLRAWYRHFDPSRFLIVLHEDFSRDPQAVVDAVTEFLGIHSLTLPERPQRSNAASLPRSRRLQNFMRRPNRVRHWLGKLVPFQLKRSIATAILARNRRAFSYPPMRPETRSKLTEYFRQDVTELEQMIGCSLDAWR